MQTDIYQYIEKKWSDEMDAFIQRIDQWDAACKGLLEDRLLRCALYLASDFEQFNLYIEMSRQDPRDVYWQAEYDCTEVRLRDLSQSFHANGVFK